jgi:beta-1,4-N-acetylglucosaminyltransferase
VREDKRAGEEREMEREEKVVDCLEEKKNNLSTPISTSSSSKKTFFALFSAGGHTAEMIALVTKLDPTWYTPRTYVVAATDALGHKKAAQAEAALLSERGRAEASEASASTSTSSTSPPPPKVITLPRAREVGQSYLTSVFTTLRALLTAVWIAFAQRPDLLLVNGPGTCLPVVVATKVAALVFRLCRGRVCYVESIARTRSLSLTGKILYNLRLADLFFVQWPSLAERFPRATCAGRLY